MSGDQNSDRMNEHEEGQKGVESSNLLFQLRNDAILFSEC